MTITNHLEGLILLSDFQSFDESIPQEITRVLATKDPLLEAQNQWETAFKVTAFIAVIFLCCSFLVPESLFFTLCFTGAGLGSLCCNHMKGLKERAVDRAIMDPCIANLALLQFQQTTHVEEYHEFFEFVRRSAAPRQSITLSEFLEYYTES